MGSRSVSGGSSTDPESCDAFGDTFCTFSLESGEFALLTRGFLVAVFLDVVAAVDGVDLEAVRVVRGGAAATVFVRVDERVDGALGLLAMLIMFYRSIARCYPYVI